MNGLEIRDLYKTFADQPALAGVSLQVQPGETLAVLGPSGCGKSTLLAIVAGLEAPGGGQVLWDGISLSGVQPHRRNFGLMFQDFALFPHRNVFENVAFGLRMASLPGEKIHQQVSQALELVGLTGFEGRDVNTLSGGEAQRVALARSLAPRPRLLMLDEPLGSLDRALREHLAQELHDILRSAGQTTMFVTHDQEEAFVIADRVAIMNAGRIEQIATPVEIYRRPASVFVARFLGFQNLLEARLSGEYSGDPTAQLLETPFGAFPIQSDLPPGPVTFLLRPDSVLPGQDGSCHLHGIVQTAAFRGNSARLTLLVGDTLLMFELPSRLDWPQPGESLEISFDPAEAIQLLKY